MYYVYYSHLPDLYFSFSLSLWALVDQPCETNPQPPVYNTGL